MVGTILASQLVRHPQEGAIEHRAIIVGESSISSGGGSVAAVRSAGWKATQPSDAPIAPWPDHTTSPVESNSSSIDGE